MKIRIRLMLFMVIIIGAHTCHARDYTTSDGWSVDTPLITKIAYDGGGRPEYIGKADPGSATSAAAWQIVKITYDGSGNPISVDLADNAKTFTKIWDSRETYTYGN